MTDTAPAAPPRPYDVQAVGAMYDAMGRYLDHSTRVLGVLLALTPKGEDDAGAKVAYAEALRLFRPVLRSLEGLFDMAMVAAEAGPIDPQPLTLARRAAIEDFAGGPYGYPSAIHVDPQSCRKVQASFETLSDTMHEVFWAVPGDFWNSAEGMLLSRRFDRAMAEAHQAFRELTLDMVVSDVPQAAQPEPSASPVS